ncbi:pentapeptide repeat-containing protein [Amycolatopsis sp. NPDC026612]|uniref:pentapeptide repeat-containing protein n=1 Tax=Amycolatopsis sp. NPDC026612 TaxID=3155466 RepID=UPI0033F8F13C
MTPVGTRRILHDSPRDRDRVLRTVTGYLRAHPITDAIPDDVVAALATLRDRGKPPRGQRDVLDLHGVALPRADLTGFDLRNADLAGGELTGSVLRDADLRGARMNRTTVREADLSECDLSDARLDGAVLVNTALGGADLRTARGRTITGCAITSASVIRFRHEPPRIPSARRRNRRFRCHSPIPANRCVLRCGGNTVHHSPSPAIRRLLEITAWPTSSRSSRAQPAPRRTDTSSA